MPIFTPPDLENPRDKFLTDVYPIYKGWENIDGFNPNHVGTGAMTPGFPRAILNTGATNGSRGLITSAAGQSISSTVSNFFTRFRIRIAPSVVDMSSSFCLLGMHASPTSPVLVAQQIAFRISNGNVLVALGNNTGGAEVDTGVDLVFGTLLDLYFRQIGPQVEFFVAGIKRATLTANFPEGANLSFSFYVSNSVAADKGLLLFPMMFTRGQP